MALQPDSLSRMVQQTAKGGIVVEMQRDSLKSARSFLLGEKNINIEGLVFGIAAANLLKEGFTADEVEKIVGAANATNIKK